MWNHGFVKHRLQVCTHVRSSIQTSDVCVLNMLNANTKWIRTDAVWALPVWQIWRHTTLNSLGSGDLTSHHTVLSVSNCWQWHYSQLSRSSCWELSQSTLKRNLVTVSGFRDNIVLSPSGTNTPKWTLGTQPSQEWKHVKVCIVCNQTFCCKSCRCPSRWLRLKAIWALTC